MSKELNELAEEIENLHCRRVETLLWASINALLENSDLTISDLELQDRVADMLGMALEELRRQGERIEAARGKAYKVAKSLGPMVPPSGHREGSTVGR